MLCVFLKKLYLRYVMSYVKCTKCIEKVFHIIIDLCVTIDFSVTIVEINNNFSVTIVEINNN